MAQVKAFHVAESNKKIIATRSQRQLLRTPINLTNQDDGKSVLGGITMAKLFGSG